MSIQFFEGFDLYPVTTTLTGYPWSGYSGTTTNNVVSAVFRNGTRSFKMPTSTNYAKNLRPVVDKTIMGVSFAMRKDGSFSSAHMGVGFYASGAATPATAGIIAGFDVNGRVCIRNRGNVIFTDTETFSVGSWVYIELKLNQISSLAELRVNNTVRGSVNYTPLGSAFTHCMIGYNQLVASIDTCYTDDLLVWDGDGVIQNDYPGDSAVIILQADADFIPQDWASTNSPAFNAIDNIPGNPAEYLSTSTPGAISRFSISDPTGVIYQVHGVAHQWRAIKDDPATAEVRGLFEVGPTVVPGPTQTLLQTDYVTYFDNHPINPNTGLPWLPSNLNNIIIGYERVT